MNMHMSHEEELLLATVRGFLEDECFPHEDMVDQTSEVPEDLGRQIEARSKELGLFACNLPEEVGGGGLMAARRVGRSVTTRSDQEPSASIRDRGPH